MYRFRYINKHVQFGQLNCTLVLDDLEGSMPSVRVEKQFTIDNDNEIDDETLYQEASKEIRIAQINYDTQQAELAAQQAIDDASSGDQ
jgi:hypothetical protein